MGQINFENILKFVKLFRSSFSFIDFELSSKNLIRSLFSNQHYSNRRGRWALLKQLFNIVWCSCWILILAVTIMCMLIWIPLKFKRPYMPMLPSSAMLGKHAGFLSLSLSLSLSLCGCVACLHVPKNMTLKGNCWQNNCSPVIQDWEDSPSTILPLLQEFMENGLRVWIFR